MTRRSYDETEAARAKPGGQLAGTLFDTPPIQSEADERARVADVAMQGEPKDARSFGHTFDARKPDAQWRRILRALAERPTMGYTRHELADLFEGAAHPIPLASVCRVVGEKLLPERLAEVSELITRESKYHADNGVLFITKKGRDELAARVAA